MKLTENNKNHLILFVASFCVTFIYFSPFFLNALRGYRPELRFYGDLQILYFPAFIQTSKYAHDWIFRGIDFFTANGSSSLFVRPNITSRYYLPQLILQTIFSITNNSFAAKIFTLQMWINGFIAMFFTGLWLNKISKINIYFSLLGGALFFSIISYSYNQITFFYVAATFPALLYCLSHSLSQKTTLSQKILLSIPFIVILTAGYLVIALMAILIAVITALVVNKYFLKNASKYNDIIMILCLGVFISSGYIIALINAANLAPGVELHKIPLSETMFFSELSLSFKAVMTIFITALANSSIGEAPHIRLGLPISILLYLVYQHFSSNSSSNIDKVKKNIFILCIILFLLSILLSMGRVSGIADMFFYTVPGFGSMHIYARYMLIFVFFLVFGLTLGLSDLYQSTSPLNLKKPFIGIVITCLTILLFPQIFINNEISLPILFSELFTSVLVLLILHFRENKKYVLMLIPILLFSQGSFMYMQENWISLSNQGNTPKDIVNDEGRISNLTNYFYSHTNKLFIKYIDLNPDVEKHGGVPQNFPWFIQYQSNDIRKISSYMGYEQALAQQSEYANKFSYYGLYNKEYLNFSGVDYVIYDQQAKAKNMEWLNTVIDTTIPECDIGNGFFAATLLQKNISQFDNGIFRISSDKADFKIISFSTNWSTQTEINFDSSKNGTIYFELFPQKNLEYYLNDLPIEPKYTPEGLAFFEFSHGKNQFFVSYCNPPLTFFLYTYLLYLIVIAFILIQYLWIKIANKHKKTNLI